MLLGDWAVRQRDRDRKTERHGERECCSPVCFIELDTCEGTGREQRLSAGVVSNAHTLGAYRALLFGEPFMHKNDSLFRRWPPLACVHIMSSEFRQ